MHVWPGALHGGWTKEKLEPVNWNPKMDPTQSRFSTMTLELARENRRQPLTSEAPKMAQSTRSALDLSKEAKNRVRGGGGGAVR